MSRFEPDLSALAAEQRALWAELAIIPQDFVLYGDTAVALRLGHRRSADFDFMSDRPFVPDDLVRAVPLLEQGDRLQSGPNTLTVSVRRGMPIAVSFFGGIGFGRAGVPDRAAGSGICIASLLDLAATKLAVVQQRAEAKDYLDLHSIFRSGLSLEQGLGAALALYENQFNPMITLKALAYFEDGDLPSLPAAVQAFLAERATTVATVAKVDRLSRVLAV